MSQAARRFAEWSAIGSLVLGMAGQVACHLLTQVGTAHPPWAITTAVSCLPVLVLGMGAALAHLLSADACDSRGSAPTPVRAPRQPDDESMDRRSQRMVLAGVWLPDPAWVCGRPRTGSGHNNETVRAPGGHGLS